MNLAFAGKGNTALPEALEEQITAGASALKLRDWGNANGNYNCLGVADAMDVQVMIHTDTLNESGFVENTVAAMKAVQSTPFTPKGLRWPLTLSRR